MGGGSEEEREARMTEIRNNALDPSMIGEMVLHAIQTNEFYILSHAEFKEQVMNRAGLIADAFDRWAEFRQNRET